MSDTSQLKLWSSQLPLTPQPLCLRWWQLHPCFLGLFISYPTPKPSASPVGSTFQMYLESDHLSPLPLSLASNDDSFPRWPYSTSPPRTVSSQLGRQSGSFQISHFTEEMTHRALAISPISSITLHFIHYTKFHESPCCSSNTPGILLFLGCFPHGLSLLWCSLRPAAVPSGGHMLTHLTISWGSATLIRPFEGWDIEVWRWRSIMRVRALHHPPLPSLQSHMPPF